MDDLRKKYVGIPSEELINCHKLERKNQSSDGAAMSELHLRGGETEFNIAKKLAKSNKAQDRTMAADILAQLGTKESTFFSESIDILIGLLSDKDDSVVESAAIGLGHRGDLRAVSSLIRLSNSQNPGVRFGVVFGLLGYECPEAIDTLIKLSSDHDSEVRNWAVFGLGSQIEVDTPQIRETLYSRIDDSHDEVRGEALFGLAARGDKGVVEALQNEWERKYISNLSLEAAAKIANPALLPELEELLERFKNDEAFSNLIEEAKAACTNNLAK